MLPPADRDIVRRDPDLPGLATVLDAAAVAALLGHPVRPVHLRYKPGTSCMATFATTGGAGGPGGAQRIAGAQGIAGAGDIAGTRDIGGPGGMVTLRALTRARFAREARKPHGAGSVRLLPDLAVIVMLPGADRRVTALRVGVDLSDAQPLRFKPERRMVLRGADRMIKAMTPATWDRAVGGARFGARQGGPEVLSVDPAHHLLATRWLPGTSAEAAPADMHRRIGAALARLHGAPDRLAPHVPAAPPAALADLSVLAPDLAPLADRLARALILALRDGPAVPCHGDFSADQVMIAPDGALSIVDWDEAGQADPARDLASYLARLEHDALTGRAMDGRDAAFLAGYGPVPATLPAHRAAALAGLATEGFRQRRPDWPDLARRLLERALALCPRTDPLAAATDPVLVSRLAGTRIATARVIRHKPGRRALVLYDDRLIGKLRFKGPDHRTPALHDRLRAAGLDGTGDTGVPAAGARIDALGMWMQDLVPGRMLTGLIAPGGAPGPLARAGRALARLHAARVPAGRAWRMEDELAVMRRALDEAGQTALAGRIGARVTALPPGPVCGIHRDFYPDQVLIDGGRAWLLDLDLYADGDPAIDLGNFLAHLDEHAIRNGWDPDALAPQAAAFLAGYGGVRALPPHVATLRMVSLARHLALARRLAGRAHTPPPILRLLWRMLDAPP